MKQNDRAFYVLMWIAIICMFAALVFQDRSYKVLDSECKLLKLRIIQQAKDYEKLNQEYAESLMKAREVKDLK